MEITGTEITGMSDSEFFEKHCNESCPWDKWLKGGCDCPVQLRLIAEFKRDIIHELFLKMVSGVGS